MTLETFNPDDQLASLKAWWKQYGNALVTGVLIGALVLAGLNYWRQYKLHNAEAASLLYESLLVEYQQGKRDAVTAAATKLTQDYSSTPYAGKAALLMARLLFDSKDLAGARQQLEWAMKNATEPAVQHSARLRLGRIQLDQKEVDAALGLVNVKDMGGFVSEYQELKGDALLAKGDRPAARAAYQAALDSLPRGSSYGRVLAMKRDDLGSEPKP